MGWFLTALLATVTIAVPICGIVLVIEWRRDRRSKSALSSRSRCSWLDSSESPETGSDGRQSSRTGWGR